MLAQRDQTSGPPPPIGPIFGRQKVVKNNAPQCQNSGPSRPNTQFPVAKKVVKSLAPPGRKIRPPPRIFDWGRHLLLSPSRSD